MDIRRIASIKTGTDLVGNRTKVKVVKNKLAPPFRDCEFDIMYSQGISKEGDLLDLATEMNIIQKSGTWYSYNEERLGQGRENVKVYLQENKEFCDNVEKMVRQKLGLIQSEEKSKPDTQTQPEKEKSAASK